MRKENTKKFRINVVDILVILLALICIATIVVRAINTDAAKEYYDLKEYRLYFQIDDIKSSSYVCFEGHLGETVRVKGSDIILGNLGAEFSRGVAIHTYTENKDGNITETQYYHPEPQNGNQNPEERCSISGYITVRGKMKNNGFWLYDEIQLLPEQILEIITEHIETSIRITSIVEK